MSHSNNSQTQVLTLDAAPHQKQEVRPTESTALPRPEYPRPQFVRADWANLNGTWDFAFDDAGAGLTESWFEKSELAGRIVVPFAYQTPLSGINDKSIHEIVWYARNVSIPEAWAGRNILLHFGAVDYKTTLWVNGVEVGHNRGGHVPFTFDITPYLKLGDGQTNRLCLRVEDRQSPLQPRGKQASKGVPSGIDYYCTTGIWQTVWMEPAPPLRIQSIDITPILAADMIVVDVFLHAPAGRWRLRGELRDGDRVVATDEIDTLSAVAQVSLELENPRPWTPDTPHLYDLRLQFLDAVSGEVLDTIESYAGLVDVGLEGGKLLLNDEPTYMVMVLDQGYWREGGMTAPTDEALRADVEWTKKFGFNGARKHQKMEDPRWLYWCDKLGLMVWGEMANARAWASEAEEAFLAEWERAVRRDSNHPCIVAWVPLNESMGLPGLRESHPGQYAFLERMVALTRRLDPARPVIDNDGWEHSDITDILAIHDYSHTGAAMRERYQTTLVGGPLPPRIWTGSRAVFVGGAKYHGQPVMLTEVGGFLALPEPSEEKRDALYMCTPPSVTTTNCWLNTAS